jgi:hypothetical protein
MPEITYAALFDYLKRLGFIESSQSALEKVLQHQATGIAMAFVSAAPAKPVRGADMLSAEVRLQSHGLLEGSLQSAILAMRGK